MTLVGKEVILQQFADQTVLPPLIFSWGFFPAFGGGGRGGGFLVAFCFRFVRCQFLRDKGNLFVWISAISFPMAHFLKSLFIWSAPGAWGVSTSFSKVYRIKVYVIDIRFVKSPKFTGTNTFRIRCCSNGNTIWTKAWWVSPVFYSRQREANKMKNIPHTLKIPPIKIFGFCFWFCNQHDTWVQTDGSESQRKHDWCSVFPPLTFRHATLWVEFTGFNQEIKLLVQENKNCMYCIVFHYWMKRGYNTYIFSI